MIEYNLYYLSFVTGNKAIWIYKNFEKGHITLEPFSQASVTS